MSDMVPFLQTVSIFKDLTTPEREILAGLFTEVHFKSNETIISEGDSSQSLYLVRSGFVNVSRGPKDHRIFLTTLSAGEYFGEAALFQDIKRTANVDAREDVHLAIIDRQSFDTYLSSNPSAANRILYQMLKQIFIRLSQTSHELQFKRKDSLAQSAIDKLFS